MPDKSNTVRIILVRHSVGGAFDLNVIFAA